MFLLFCVIEKITYICPTKKSKNTAMEYSYFSLSAINNSLRQLFKEVFLEPIWIKAEISEIHKNSSGHCYLELIEKDLANTIIARQKATIWANNYKTLEPYFESKAQTSLQAGLEVLILCHIEMHEVYGMSLNIVDINAEYTIGRLAIEKEGIIKQLTADGVIDLNRSLVFPDLPQRIAVISSETAAGYEDFVHQLESNSYGYKFSIDLFDARMQGSETEKSVIEAIDNIFENIDKYDVLVIIRGGGATTDISAFDSYNIASHIAQFPLPVICGIGHLRDKTILDIVSHTSVKTPTAAAEFIIDCLLRQEDRIDNIAYSVKNRIGLILEKEKGAIGDMVRKLSYIRQEYTVNERINIAERHQRLMESVRKILNKADVSVSYIAEKINTESNGEIKKHRNRIYLLEKTVALLSPEAVLKRGYTIVKQDNKFIKFATAIDKNKSFTVVFGDGAIEANSD